MLHEFSDFVNDIYEAATNFSNWDEIIEKLAQTTRASSSVFLVVNNKKPELTYGEFLVNVDPEHRILYESGYYNKLDKFSMQLGLLSGKAVHSTKAIATKPEHYLQREVESDFFGKFGYDHRIGFAIPHGTDHHICLYLNRSKKDGDFETPDETIKLLELLSPHIKRSMQISERITIKDDLVTSLSCNFQGKDSGIIFLDAKGEIVFINEKGENLLKSYSHIISYSKTITLKNQDNRLDELITSSLLYLENGIATPGGAVSVSGKSSKQYLDILVSPIKLNHLICTYFKRAKVCIFLTPSNIIFTCTDTFQQLYKLTRTESSILIDYLNQPDINDIAELRNGNIQTIRSQMKSIMRKMNVSKQTELIKKVMHGPCRFIS
ncbi:MAG: hypothetical protein ABW170_08150 [Candidatus Thiodiazotropha sp. L084R]